MADCTVYRSMFGTVRLLGEGRCDRGNVVDARGAISLACRAYPVDKSRFVHMFYEEELGDMRAEDFPDEVLPDLDKPSLRAYSSYWVDLTIDDASRKPFGGSNNIWEDEGQVCYADDAEADRIRIAAGSNAAISVNLKETTERTIAAYISGKDYFPLPYSIEFLVNFFLDNERNDGQGAVFKTVRLQTTVSPAAIQVQIIRLEGEQNHYRVVAGPSPSAVRFVKHPACTFALEPDRFPCPSGWASAIVIGNLLASRVRPELLAVGERGEVGFVDSVENLAACGRENVFYALQASKEALSLSHENVEEIEIAAMKILPDGSVVEATEAVVAIEEPHASSLLNCSMAEPSYRRGVRVLVDQAKGVRASRRSAKAILGSSDSYLHFLETLRLTLQVGSARITRDLPVVIKLPRWIPLCPEATKRWSISPPDGETHLRTNAATILHSFNEGIRQHNKEASEAQQAHFNVAALTRFDKLGAGNFLFRFNSGDDIARIFFLTRPDEVIGAARIYDAWHTAVACGADPPEERPPTLTEASLAVEMFDAYRTTRTALSTGDVLRLGLKETGGDIGAAMLLCHNTLRSMARRQDGARTGINEIDDALFQKIFQPIRGGARCGDGAPGAPKDGTIKEANFANDYSGPWYHLFGTAFYEIYTAGKPSAAETAGDEGLGREANDWEQAYREWCTGEAPDPEKYCINLWGVNAAASLRRAHRWLE
jgi:hypothetical protein